MAPAWAATSRGWPSSTMAIATMRRAVLLSADFRAPARNCAALKSNRTISIAEDMPIAPESTITHRLTFSAAWESQKSHVFRRLVLDGGSGGEVGDSLLGLHDIGGGASANLTRVAADRQKLHTL